MKEYYLIFRSNKNKIDSATHAVFIGELPPEAVESIKEQIVQKFKPRRGELPIEIIFFEKRSMPESKVARLEELIAAYENDSQGIYCPELRMYRNHVLYQVEEMVENYRRQQETLSAVPVEYFVSYNRTVYPRNCKSLTDCDEPLIEKQQSKKCFTSFCKRRNCPGRAGDSYCNWGWCSTYPYRCDTDPCPESKRELTCRTSIGVLTAEERDAFGELTNIKDSEDFVLSSGEDFGKTLVKRIEHNRLLEKYSELVGDAGDRIFNTMPDFVQRMMQYEQTANEIRSCRPAEELTATTQKQDEPPRLTAAASGKGNRPTSLAEIKVEETEIAWADEPADVRVADDSAKVIEDAVYRGTLRAQFVGKNLNEKERNVLLNETLGVGPTEIARRNGTPESDVESEADKIRKQLDRDKKKR